MNVQERFNEDKLVDLESERRVLSAMLNSEEACIEAYNALTEDDFYSPVHRIVFSIICRLYEKEVRPTFVELLKEVDEANLFQSPGEAAELSYIAKHFIDDQNVGYWIGRVKDQARLRRFESFLRRSYQKLFENKERSADEILAEAEGELTGLTISDSTDKVDEPAELAALGYHEVERRVLRYKEIKEVHRGIVPLDGLPTGLYALDNLTLGYKPGELIIVGAQTGHGKTAFALHTAKAVAVEQKHNLLYLNTEMSRTQIALRWGSILSGVEHEKIRRGELTANELSDVLKAYAELEKSGFYSYPCPNLTPEKLVSIARKFKVQRDIKMVILDYVGRMEKMTPIYTEWQILEQIVKNLKMLAQNLQIAVMCLVQLNEDGSLQGARRMKNESDLLLKLIPIKPEEIKENEDYKGYRDLNYRILIDKNRDGQSGVDVLINFDLSRQIIKDATPL